MLIRSPVVMPLVFLGALIFLGCVIIFLMGKVGPYFREMFEKYDGLNASVQENLTSIRVVKAYVREEQGADIAVFVYPPICFCSVLSILPSYSSPTDLIQYIFTRKNFRLQTHASVNPSMHCLKSADSRSIFFIFYSSQQEILFYLGFHEGEPIHQREIEKWFHLKNPTVTGILNRLEENAIY